MTPRMIILAGLLQFTPMLVAQLPGINESGAKDVTSEISKNSVPTGTKNWINTIQNMSEKEIQALHVTCLYTTEDGRTQSDDNGSMDAIFQFSHDRPIPAGQVYVAKVTVKGDCTASTDAVVFSNGEVEGEADKVAVIFERRSGAYKALATVIPLLDKVASGSMKASDLAALLEGKINALSNDRSLTANEVTGESFVFGVTISVLRSPNGRLITPSDNSANKQPGFDDIMKEKGVSLEQARATVHANKFREWQAALKDHTEPPGTN